MAINLSALRPALQAAFRPLIVEAAEEDEDARSWDDPIDDSDAQHDMRRDWTLEDAMSANLPR